MRAGAGEEQRVIFSEDPREGFAQALAKALRFVSAKRVLLLTTPSRRHLESVADALGELPSEVFDGSRVHVPAEVVREALARVDAFRPDTLIALGGGAPTGLGKALCLERDLAFIAIPTTYSASERTTLWGMTSGRDKRTGRDPRVRPDVVLYEPAFSTGMPMKLSVQSLMNALAHPVSALSTGTLSEGARQRALDTIRVTTHALARLASPTTDAPEPDVRAARRAALEAASLAGEVIEAGQLGVHHRIAHFLGGRFGLPHAALHALLLPHTLEALAAEDGEAFEAICAAAKDAHLPESLQQTLRDAGAETALAELGVDAEALEAALAERPELPAALIRRAYRGPLGR